MKWLSDLWDGLADQWKHFFRAVATSLFMFFLLWLTTGKRPEYVPPPIPLQDYPQIDGWQLHPEEITKGLEAIEKIQGFKPVFSAIAQGPINAADDDGPVFFWEAEQKVVGKILPSWDQGQVGCCVSFGWGRAIQDLMFAQAAKGGEKWNGKFVATEPLYGGGRVQIGKGRLGNSDGSLGTWQGQFVLEENGGVLFRQEYLPNWNFSEYSQQMARKLGVQGCPAELIPLAKQHPVKTVALVKTSDEVWTAIGNGYPVPICSNVGFQSPLRDGFCVQSGSWGHCMEIRGRFKHPSKGKCFVIQNSWGDYLRSDGSNNVIQVVYPDGSTKAVTLPQGCFGVTSQNVSRIVGQGDSFAISGFKGFPARRTDWLIQNKNDNHFAAGKHSDMLFSVAP